MRVNVYSQELSDNAQIVESKGFQAVRLYMRPNENLHDDDQSAVTFWLPKSSTRREEFARTLERVAQLVRLA